MRARLMLLLPLAAALACGGGSDSGTNPGPGPGGGGGGGGAVTTTAVDMKNNVFSPAAIKVSPGATVNFTNSDGYNHNASFTTAGITSTGNYATGTKSVVMPAAVGTYAYTCTLHAGMSGTVQVAAP